MHSFSNKTKTAIRLVGLLAGGYPGILLGMSIAEHYKMSGWQPPVLILGCALGCAIIGLLVLLPIISFLYTVISKYPSSDIVSTGIGLLFGLAAAFLLRSIVGQPVGFVATMLLTLICVTALILCGIVGHSTLKKLLFKRKQQETSVRFAVDASALIDGRIKDVAQTGFLQGELLIPEAVLLSMQTLADQADPVKRSRGRRGLDMASQLKAIDGLIVTVMESGAKDAESELLALAKRENCPILTVDYNLNKLAGAMGLAVRNVNELANALKSTLIAGESLTVHILKQGKEPVQGIAYLDDGTMIVVENGGDHIGQTVTTTVTTVMQTNAGRLIFVRI